MSVQENPEETGLPLLRRWSSVYLLVIVNFLLWLILLWVLTVSF